MRKSKRARTKKNPKDFYQIPKDCEEEIQRSCEFVNKLKELDDKTVFIEFLDAMKSYHQKSLSYIELKTKITFILRNNNVLLQDLNQLLSDLGQKSDVERTVEFLNKLEGLGKGIHSAFLNQIAYSNDIPSLVSKLNFILREHPSLKNEFKTFLIDSGLLKENEYVTPSYMMRHEAEEVSSSVLNGEYVSVGHAFTSSRVKTRRVVSLQEMELNNLEDELFEEDRYFAALKSVVKFGRSKLLNKKPPVGLNEFLRRFYRGKSVPREFKTEPKRAVQAILPTLKHMLKKMRVAKTLKVNINFWENKAK